MSARPQTGLYDSSTVYRINSTAAKVSAAFDAARIEARDECLWLAHTCRNLLDDNDRLRVALERAHERIVELERRRE